LFSFYQKHWFLLLVILLTLIAIRAAWIFIWATSEFGIGIRSDSVAYIWSARNLAGGSGLGRPDGMGNFKPMTHWPPLYPLLLAFFEILGLDVIEGARWLGAFLFAMNIVLVGWILSKLTRSFWFSLGGAAVMAMAPAIAETSLFAMTEPLYISLSLLSFILIDEYLKSHKRIWLILSAMVVSMAFLTRYAGLSLVATGVIILLLQQERTHLDRVKESIPFFLISISSIVIWVIRNMIVSGSTTNRVITYYPISEGHYNQILTNLQDWFKPVFTVFHIGDGKLILSIAALLFLVGLFLYRRASQGEKNPKRTTIGRMIGIYFLLYTIIIFISRWFFNPLLTIWEQRILSPIFISLLLMILFLLFHLWRKIWQKNWLLGGIITVVYIWTSYSFIILYSTQSEFIFQRSLESGGGYAFKSLLNSEMVAALKQLPEDHIVYTTNIEEFYYFTGRSSYGYPKDFDSDYIVAVNENIAKQGVIFVNFHYSLELEKIIWDHFPDMNLIFDKENVTIYINDG
jgi:4-amino-4-deoxy-L-arabinose transferase-like glycosyltransferase